MKRILLYSTLLLIGLLVFAACSDGEVGKSPKKFIDEMDSQPGGVDEVLADTVGDLDSLDKTVEKEVHQVVAPSPIQSPKPIPGEPKIIVGGMYEPPIRPIPPVDPPAIRGGRNQDPMNKIVDFPDVNPEFPGGQVAMKKFIDDNLIYPEIDKELGKQGRVYVQFIVEKDGSLTNIHVMRRVSETLDQEAIRIVSSMPNWQPGESNGELTRTRVRMPITFVFE